MSVVRVLRTGDFVRIGRSDLTWQIFGFAEGRGVKIKSGQSGQHRIVDSDRLVLHEQGILSTVIDSISPALRPLNWWERWRMRLLSRKVSRAHQRALSMLRHPAGSGRVATA